MNEVQYLHLRNRTLTGKAARGGITFAYLVDTTDRTIKFAFAECSDKDIFCKKTGRDLATQRLVDKQFVSLTEHDVQNVIVDLCVPHIFMDKSIAALVTLEKLSRKFIHWIIRNYIDQLSDALASHEYGPIKLDLE